MNIFVLDTDITTCARCHCDQHVVKMILESTQIICTALNQKGFSTPYRPTHVKHPCVIWAGTSFENLQWLKCLAIALNEEYRFRFETSADHQSLAVIKTVDGIRFESKGLTEFAQAMPEKYKVPGDPVLAYRQFYVGEKLRFARWTKRNPPQWVDELISRSPAPLHDLGD